MPRFAKFETVATKDAIIIVNLEHVVTVRSSALTGTGHPTCELVVSTGYGTIHVLGSLDDVENILQSEYGYVLDGTPTAEE